MTLAENKIFLLYSSICTHMRYTASTIVLGIIAFLLTAACATPTNRVEPHDSQVLFVCEHGNVKSLMAASYFNQMARERGLPYRAVSRGSAPDSTTVPAAIVEALRDDGFDVTAFHPAAVSTSEVSASQRVILISTVLPATAQVPGIEPEQWNDVPPASIDYGAARDSLKSHVVRLVDQLAHPEPK